MPSNVDKLNVSNGKKFLSQRKNVGITNPAIIIRLSILDEIRTDANIDDFKYCINRRP